MRFLALARTHFRLAARQRALWIVSLGLALLSVTITVNPGLSFETDNPAALALTAQMLALMPPVAYAAAFTDLASESERLGISEIEASAPVPPFELVAARVAGALAAMALPSVGVLLFCAGGQMLHGNVWALLQAAVLLAGVVLPAALVAAALSAFAGSLLPRALARIAAIVAWFGVLFLGVFVPTPTAGGGLRVHIAADPVAQVLFGSTPLLDSPESAVTAATPLEAIALLALKLAAAVALLFFLQPEESNFLTASVVLEGETIAEYELSTLTGPVTLVVDEAPYPLTIQAEPGRIRIAESACPSQDCVHTGWISRAGQQIICLPDKLVISLSGSGSQEFDAISG